MSTAVHRTDLLAHAMNPGKEKAVLAVLRAWQRCAVRLGGEQWRLFYEGVGFLEDYRNPGEASLGAVAGAANRVQMCRYQVAGALKSFLSNRKNDFAERVTRMEADPARRPWWTEDLRHEVLFVNSWRAWFSRGPLQMQDGREVSPLARDIARRLMRDILAHHRKPDLSGINMVMDGRAATLMEAVDPEAFWAAEKQEWEERQARRAAEVRKKGKTPKPSCWMRKSRKRWAPPPEREKQTVFPLWVKVPTMDAGRTIWVPLLPHERFLEREGERCGSIQINHREGHLTFGVVTDIATACEKSRAAYEPLIEELALDFGLRTLFATDRGDLLGRGFLIRLREYDGRISALAAYRQKHGLKVRSPRYDREVERLRGFLRSEIGRVLNHLAQVQRPGRIIVEKLAFRSPALSRRMNRLVSNCGRKIIEDKLTDLGERFGIEIVPVNAAYSSQTCSLCEYVDRKNRTGEKFRCRWCGHVVHADVNAPRNLRARRSRPAVGSVKRTKAAVLRAQVQVFLRRCAERSEGRRGTSRDPRLTNPYFADWRAEVISSGNGHGVTDSPCASEP